MALGTRLLICSLGVQNLLGWKKGALSAHAPAPPPAMLTTPDFLVGAHVLLSQLLNGPIADHM